MIKKIKEKKEKINKVRVVLPNLRKRKNLAVRISRKVINPRWNLKKGEDPKVRIHLRKPTVQKENRAINQPRKGQNHRGNLDLKGWKTNKKRGKPSIETSINSVTILHNSHDSTILSNLIKL